MQVLVLLDKVSGLAMIPGAPPQSRFSHDRHIFQFAHEARRQGMDVICAAVQDDPRHRRHQRLGEIYPLWQPSDELSLAEIDPDIVVSVFPEALNVRGFYPRAKIVSIHAAVHWIESPELFSAQYVYDLIAAVRHNTDFIVTQNERMRSLLLAAYGFLARWPYPDRVLVCPLSLVTEEVRPSLSRAQMRRTMGLAPDEIAIINMGGIWRWTDFNCFLEAFCEHCVAQPTRLKLFVMGFRQAENRAHDDYQRETVRILARHPELLGSRVVAETIWGVASEQVAGFAAGADVGLNISADGIELWQSYRVRFLEYLALGLPVINSMGDAMTRGEAAAGMFAVSPGDTAEYRRVLQTIDRDPMTLAPKAAAMRHAAEAFGSEQTYGALIEHIVATPRRADHDTTAWGPCVLDYAQDLERTRQQDQMRQRVASFVANAISAPS